jgi:hypothetical protein
VDSLLETQHVSTLFSFVPYRPGTILGLILLILGGPVVVLPALQDRFACETSVPSVITSRAPQDSFSTDKTLNRELEDHLESIVTYLQDNRSSQLAQTASALPSDEMHRGFRRS